MRDVALEFLLRDGEDAAGGAVLDEGDDAKACVIGWEVEVELFGE